ncbi:uncharacterized protein MONBRDRAFT_26403 [Monosiga brevicollis MX1]|uniref:Hexosyltransferase n=1 Tax=Monosiga brevicollis TaxID=81824 RepID=A9V296_MONBE|nr:uncharacterized protein MONBRDRAFT_26403 [Monosiga brevicollis MX1]EDQ88219.1 predicted protein [Monosiga brevicollis MX1]|eukprot:XP_001746812.1 hypothetical protein [Monosiga brevicollis MX1]
MVACYRRRVGWVCLVFGLCLAFGLWLHRPASVAFGSSGAVLLVSLWADRPHRRQSQLSLFRSYAQHQQMPTVNREAGATLPSVKALHVVTASSEENFAGLLALLNSVYRNVGPGHAIRWHVITLQAAQLQLEAILAIHFPDRDIEVIGFSQHMLAGKIRVRSSRASLGHPLNYARYYLPGLLPDLSRVIYLDDDVIVQGDITELWELNLQGQPAAFSSDCNEASRQYGLLQNRYGGFLNYENSQIKALNLPSEENVYGSGVAGGGSQPPMLIVFHKQVCQQHSQKKTVR